MKKIYVLIILGLVFAGSQAYAQDESPSKPKKAGFFKRYINKILNDTVSQEKSQFFMYPTLGFRPETGLELGFSPLYVYYANEDTSNRLSELNAYAFFTFNGQYGLNLDHALYGDKDEWFFLGDLQFEKFPLKYYGIGNAPPEDNIALVDAIQVRIKERVLKKIVKNFYIGLETDFQLLTDVSFESPEDSDQPIDFELPFGAEGTTTMGLGLGLVFDERHNVLNERNAFFSEFAFINQNPFFKSDVKYNSITTDTRFFKSVNKRNVIATQLLGEFNFSGEVPFNQLALMGGDNIMRGYFTGRFRDNNQIAAQIEYRMLPLKLGFTDRIGATVFTSVGEVFNEFQEIKLNEINWAAGAGLRFLLFKQKDVYLRFDYAINPDENGFYIGIGEAF